MNYGRIDHYRLSKEKNNLLVIAFFEEDETYDCHRVQIKLADIPVVLETLKNIDHDPSEEGTDDYQTGGMVNTLVRKRDDDYFYNVDAEYNPWGYHDPRNLRFTAIWKDKSIKSHEFAISYWTYEELKTEVNRLVDAIETALKE